MNAVDAVAQAFSTLNIGTRLGKRLAADRVLAPEPHAAITQPSRFDIGAGLHAGVLECAHVGLAREVTEAHAGVLLECGGVGSNYIDIAHVFLSVGFAGI